MHHRIGACLARIAGRGAAGLLLACLLAAGAGASHAAELPWQTAKKYQVNVERKELRDLLREFTASYGISVVIDESVGGSVTGRFELTPQSMLEYLSATFSFVWFYDGNVLYVSPSNSMVSEIIPMPPQNAQRSLRTLEQLGLVDRRFPINYDVSARLARVAGPKPYVELIRNTLRGIDTDASTADEAVVRVFRLRYAFAADQRVDASSESAVPGVATMLASLFPAQPPPGQRNSLDGPLRMQRVPVKGANISIPEPPGPADLLQQAAASSGGGRNNNLLPQFRADPGLNAVIVRDMPQRIAQYDEVIKSLDIKPLVVEIEARIIEISIDAFESLGVDWRLNTGHVDIQTGRGPLQSLDPGTALTGGGAPFLGSLGEIGQLGLKLSSGAVATTVLTDAGRSLIARVNALAQNGRAAVTSSPKVLTLDNIEAVIEDTRQFYVRVASERDAGLFQVNSGTSLRVRPMVVAEDTGRQVKLAIRIEDGAPTASQVDSIPVVRRTSIGTWAFINEGESLLIGGFTTEAKRNGETGVPVLSRIPILGALFRNREKQQVLVERLFMLTPRIVPR